MRHNLERILACTLETSNVSNKEWLEKKYSSEGHIVRVRQIVSYIACIHDGYSRTEVGRFLGKNHATITHYIRVLKEQCCIYPDLQRHVDRAAERLEPLVQEQREAAMQAWLARSSTGLLTISPTFPESYAGYWIAEGSRPFPQDQFPQITYEKGPAKVQILVTLEEDEKM